LADAKLAAVQSESRHDSSAAETVISLAGKPDAPRTEEPDQVMARNIAGVRAERLAGYHDHRGSLVPFMDFTKPFWNEPIRASGTRPRTGARRSAGS